jgi:integrase
MRGCRPLLDEEIIAILKHLEDPKRKRARALFLIGIRTGLKIGVILNLTISDVSENGRVCDNIWISRPTIKNRSAGYYMPLHRETIEALQLYLNSCKGSVGYVFKGRYPYTHLKRIQAWRMIRNAFKELNIAGYHGELGSICMRKTYARLIYNALHRDLVKTRYALRHASILSTCRFMSFNEAEVDTAITSL